MPAATLEREQIFVENVDAIRASRPLDNFMPEGLPTFDLLDMACMELYASGILQIVGNAPNRRRMEKMKDQTITRAQFKSLMHSVLESITEPALNAAAGQPIPTGDIKAAISWRAGNAFIDVIDEFRPDIDIGYSTQFRDEKNPRICRSDNRKLGWFDEPKVPGSNIPNPKKAVAFDVMLATGNSMRAMIEGYKNASGGYDRDDDRGIMGRGATGVIVGAAFATPQGIIEVSRMEGVERIIVPRIAAGLTAPVNNEGGAFVVDGVGDRDMVRDCGNRLYGNTDNWRI